MTSECCAHSIVKHTKVHVGDGAIKDAWACCDCGMRFEFAPHLPTFAPEPSHLHLKLDQLRAEVKALLALLRRVASILRGAEDEDQSAAYYRAQRVIDAAIDAAREEGP